MAKLYTGIEKRGNRFLLATRNPGFLYVDDHSLNDLIWKHFVYIPREGNDLPREFDHLRGGENHSVCITLSADNISKNPHRGNEYLITGLTKKDFSFLLRGKKKYPLKFMDADMYRQYCSLKDSLEGHWGELRDIEYDDVADNDEWDAGNIYDAPGEIEETRNLDWYILQKRYGYGAVYYKMFRSFFEQLVPEFDENGQENVEEINLHVVSVGCGSKTDAISLRYAMMDRPGLVGSSKYIGIDPGKWDRSEFLAYLNLDDAYFGIPECTPENGGEAGEYYISSEIRIFREEVAQSLRDFEAENQGARNVYAVLFPNMLSEINPAGLLEDLLKAIEEVYQGKELYILTSRNPEPIDEGQIMVLREKCDSMIDSYYDTEGENLAHFLEYHWAKAGEGSHGRDPLAVISEVMYNAGRNGLKYPIVNQRFIRYEIYRYFGNA